MMVTMAIVGVRIKIVDFVSLMLSCNGYITCMQCQKDLVYKFKQIFKLSTNHGAELGTAQQKLPDNDNINDDH